MPGSLVFLVIIAVWAAYFVQYWIRRREHLATARSVDEFSESMRILERRSPLPASNLSTPQPRSYVVTPARAARQQVLVKRAETAREAGLAAAAPIAPVAPARGERASTRTTTSAARRIRAVIMLGALATLVVTVPLVALSLLPLLALLVPVLAIGGAVAWARASAEAQRRSRRATRPEVRTEARPAVPAAVPVVDAAMVDAAVDRDHIAGERFTGEQVAEEPVAEVTEPRRSATPRGELYDVQAVESGLRHAAPVTDQVAGHSGAGHSAAAAAAPTLPPRPLVDEDDIPLTWDPVPVPRPTYTMKSRVTRPAPTSADLVGDADTEYAAYEDVPERRVAGA